ncbi:YheT family hydrolase [Elongatibacter sediminis]|uniref:Alpha/beta fold hydrolase n=1 Tax=Elongatibacter sediminis TaxID=3119006 RepID=A0AAW9R630_9GAMM
MTDRLETFLPPPGLRSRHAQSLLSSSPIRRRLVRRRSESLRAVEEAWELNGGDDIRLEGFHSAQRDGRERGLVVLLHGWEGSVNSNYILSNGARLFDAGFNVFRLNFRDHGETHHLNSGIFHSCRLDEVVLALRDLQARIGERPWCLAGYSLGGNFALRVALQAGRAGLRLQQVFSVCPVIDPARAMLAMEQGIRFYERYFEHKWSRSLRIKQACFPDLYGDEDWHRIRGLRARTHYLATRYAGFADEIAYFDGYSIAGDRLAPLKVPATILTSADDPVVPVDDFARLPEIPWLEVLVTKYGGHCGFLKNWKLESLAEDLLLERMLRATGEAEAAGRSLAS